MPTKSDCLGTDEPWKLRFAAAFAAIPRFGFVAFGLGDDLSVATLAAKAALSPRQFSRAFQAGFAMTPAAYVETLWLDAAQYHLTSTGAAIKEIAVANGFVSDDSFSRAFDRRFTANRTSPERNPT